MISGLYFINRFGVDPSHVDACEAFRVKHTELRRRSRAFFGLPEPTSLGLQEPNSLELPGPTSLGLPEPTSLGLPGPTPLGLPGDRTSVV